jgi:hypothetical protein
VIPVSLASDPELSQAIPSVSKWTKAETIDCEWVRAAWNVLKWFEVISTVSRPEHFSVFVKGSELF